MSKPEHSPLPWHCYGNDIGYADARQECCGIPDSSGGCCGSPNIEWEEIQIASTGTDDDAQFIVTACNSYYDNQQAIAELVSLLGSFVDYDQLNFNQQVDLVEHAERLIAKHKAKP